MTEWCTKIAADDFWEQLDEISAEMETFELRKEDNKKFYLVIEDKGLKIKVKFHKDEAEEL